jgi:hypothetical protein
MVKFYINLILPLLLGAQLQRLLQLQPRLLLPAAVRLYRHAQGRQR